LALALALVKRGRHSVLIASCVPPTLHRCHPGSARPPHPDRKSAAP